MATVRLTEAHDFPAPAAFAFDTLVDPAAIRSVLPGCEAFDPVADEQYRVTIAVNLIAFTATVSGDVTITDRVRPQSYSVFVTGQGSLGSIDIRCQMRLSENGANSRLDYDIEVDAMGQLGLMAAPILAPAAKLIVGQFMGNMEREIVSRLGAGR